jgi:hypothetical protein
MNTDLLYVEGGSGGDLVVKGNDVALTTGVENMPYLAMFAGDVFWANNLMPTDGDLQFTSLTYNALLTNPLSSQGRINIENAIKADLNYLKTTIPGSTLVVSATIVSSERLDIDIQFNGTLFLLQWNPNELFLTYRI